MPTWPVMLRIGDRAPDFSAPDDTGSPIRLSQFRGTHVVLYFYPKDDTTSCTKEACSFRDSMAKLTELETVVIGASPDDVDSHAKFKEKHHLPFMLVADVDHKIAEAYGVWIERSMMGKSYWTNARTTFLIDPDGGIAHIWEKVAPDGHADEVFQVLEQAVKATDAS